MNAADVRAAVIALLNAEPVTESAFGYSTGQLAELGERPAGYTEVVVMERPRPGQRVGGAGTTHAWRIVTRAVGASEALADEIRARARTRLFEQSVTVGDTSGFITSPNTDNPIAEDGEYFSGPSEWSLHL